MDGKTKEIELSILVVNFRTPELACDAVNSVLRSGLRKHFEIIIVDNASGDNSVTFLTDAFKDDKRIRIIASPDNLGFAGGNNLGLRAASGKIVLFLNPDTIVGPGAIDALIDALRSSDDIGAVGGMLTDAESRPVTSFGFFPTPWSMITTAFVPGRFYGRARRALGVAPDAEDKQSYEVDYICGADLMVRRDILDEIGGMDDGYFMYFEETDLCKRIRDKGLRILYEPKARIAHLEGGSFGDKVTRRRMIFMKSSVRFFRKNGYSPFFIGLYHAVTFISCFIKLGYFWLKYLLVPSRREQTARNIAWNGFIFPYYLGYRRRRFEL